MRENIVSLTPSLRCYAHALLGRWPLADRRVVGRIGADQDADDLAHVALLGFWRAGLAPLDDGSAPAMPEGALRLALLRCITSLARAALRQSVAEQAEAPDLDDKDLLDPAPKRTRYFPWGPEARALPRLPFESRAVLALAALEQLNYDEIGQVLDMSAGQALAKLARARGQMANEVSGESRPFLRAAGQVAEADLHLFADDLLEESRRAEVEALLQTDSDSARRAGEWRRGAERLRGAFAGLLREPVPVTLNFAPSVAARPRRARQSWLKGLAGRLGAPRPALRAH
jgi:DNA-directed RNA polymerase specialized sigma24 family protein